MLIEFPTFTWNCDCKALSNHVLLDTLNPSWKVLLLLSFQNVDENPNISGMLCDAYLASEHFAAIPSHRNFTPANSSKWSLKASA